VPAHAQPYIGSPDLEPGLANRDDILLFEDFEYADWQSHFSNVSHDQNLDIVSSPVFQGASALRVRANQGEHYGTSITFGFQDLGLAEPEEIYFRYYVYIDSSWNHADSDGEIGKFPGFGGTYGVAGWGGQPSDGTNGWSARMMNWDDGNTAAVGFYTYHADMGGIYGTHMRWDPALERDRWYCIEAYVQMNTITGGNGNNDGILLGWVDDVDVFDETGLRFRDVDHLKIETVWINIYVGGSWTADHDMELYFDNMVVAPNPIGCYQEGAGGSGAGGVGGSGAGSGTGGTGATGAGGAGATGAGSPTGGAAATPGAPAEDSGCGCRLAGSRTGTPLAVTGLLLALLGALRRRRLRAWHD
jgi:hypothetical protein